MPDGDERSIYDFAQTQLDKHRGDAGQYDERAAGGEGDRVEGGNAVRSLRFRLLNLRDAEGYRFGLFTGGPSNPVLVAKTEEAVTFARSYEVRMYIYIFKDMNIILWQEANETYCLWLLLA